MELHFRCPGPCQCGAPCSVAAELANRMIACPRSGSLVRVPARTFSEDDWRRSTDPQEMLLGLPVTVENRRLRLFALACCQRIEARLTHPLSRQALMLA